MAGIVAVSLATSGSIKVMEPGCGNMHIRCIGYEMEKEEAFHLLGPPPPPHEYQ